MGEPGSTGPAGRERGTRLWARFPVSLRPQQGADTPCGPGRDSLSWPGPITQGWGFWDHAPHPGAAPRHCSCWAPALCPPHLLREAPRGGAAPHATPQRLRGPCPTEATTPPEPLPCPVPASSLLREGAPSRGLAEGPPAGPGRRGAPTSRGPCVLDPARGRCRQGRARTPPNPPPQRLPSLPPRRGLAPGSLSEAAEGGGAGSAPQTPRLPVSQPTKL